MTARLGYGMADPALGSALADLAVAATEAVAWAGTTGRMDLHLGAWPDLLPDYLVTSVRCVVTVGDAVLVCRTPNDSHCMPGGRREAGESWEQTARREVAEETGWHVGPLVPLGIIRFALVSDFRDDHPYPHPDLIWAVFDAEGVACASEGWADTEGWELATDVVPFDEVGLAGIAPIELELVAEARRRRSAREA